VEHHDSGPRLISGPQEEFLRTLLFHKHIKPMELCQIAGVRSIKKLTMAQASQYIDALKTNDGALKRQVLEIRGQMALL
jgi:hypothetical protein